jgi:hypothetical protein
MTSNDVVIKSPKEISGTQALLMIPLTKFFCSKTNIEKLLDIVEGKSNISLRLIDWFVTNYSKKNNIMYNPNVYKKKKKIKKADFADFFNVFQNYKSQLKAYSKKHFDPFCRRIRIHFYYSKENYLITTVGQLNFFKWAIENYVVDYIKENIKDIEKDMNINVKTSNTNSSNTKKNSCGVATKKGKKTAKKSGGKKKSKGTQRKKRHELSESASKTMVQHHCPTVITFD